MTAALAIENLHFGYGRRTDVRGVTLQLQPGDCYGFLGHNGAGKTTVMRLCLGLLRPTQGRVLVYGLDTTRDRRRTNALIGAVIERPGFHGRASARSNLIALARLQGIARKLAGAEADRVLERVGLEDAAKRRVQTFSMGMRQRLGIAQALLGRPRLLLLDEPTNGLDPEGIADLRALLQRLTREDGIAVMLSSHQLAELEGLCTRIGVLREGEMVVEGDLDSLRRRIDVRHVVQGQPLDHLQEKLRELQLEPSCDGDRLLVDLGTRSPADVARELANHAELTSFAPEPASLERIYLQAGDGKLSSDAPAAITETKADTAPGFGSVARPRWRAFRHEVASMLRHRSTLPLLLTPCVVAIRSVHSYAGTVAEGLRLVELEERFSADAGSGHLATAQALQNATPVLGVALIWFASQSIAADVTNDTLRNTLTRSLRRGDVMFGKFAALLSMLFCAWLALVATTMVASAATVGFGDLEEVSRYGDRDLLAEATEVWPTLWVTLLQMMLPLAAVVAVAAAASALARRPALALASAFGLLLLPELARAACGERAGWLLTSHLPVLWQDDSAIGYTANVARGAADALWVWADYAVIAPLAWLCAGLLVMGTVLNRMRIR